MAELESIHDYKYQTEKFEKRLSNSDKLSEKNKETIRRFQNVLINKGVGKARVWRVGEYTKRIGEWLGKEKNFEEATREDIERITTIINSNLNYSWATISGYKIALRQFYKWLLGNDEEYPKIVKWVQSGRKQRQKKLPTELITEEDVQKVLSCCRHPRDKALISLLWETGARIGEIGTAQIKALNFNNGEGELVIHGKTGWRKVLLISSVPFLKDWLKYHPYQEDKEAALFTMLGNHHQENEPISYCSIAKMLRSTMKRAKINKGTNPHLWRHSRATFLANYLTEAQLCSVMGWVIGSKEAGTYIHLSGKETNDTIRSIYGQPKQEKKLESILTPIKCQICGENNEPRSDICVHCNNPLSIKGAVEKVSKIKELEERLSIVDAVLEKLSKFENLEEKIDKIISQQEAQKLLATAMPR